jgi:hypothetical protein
MSEQLQPETGLVRRTQTAIDAAGGSSRLSVDTRQGGLLFSSMAEVVEFGKLMAMSSIAVPKHLRGDHGACMAICLQALEWKMSPYAVASKSYVVNDRISYESQLIHAVIEMRAPLIGRLRNSYTGEGDTRRCTITGNVRGEADPMVFTSSTFRDIQPKNSPLWKTKPDLQLYYNACRDWCRMYFPDILLGVYAEDELPQPTPYKPPAAQVAILAETPPAPRRGPGRPRKEWPVPEIPDTTDNAPRSAGRAADSGPAGTPQGRADVPEAPAPEKVWRHQEEMRQYANSKAPAGQVYPSPKDYAEAEDHFDNLAAGIGWDEAVAIKGLNAWRALARQGRAATIKPLVWAELFRAIGEGRYDHVSGDITLVGGKSEL